MAKGLIDCLVAPLVEAFRLKYLLKNWTMVFATERQLEEYNKMNKNQANIDAYVTINYTIPNPNGDTPLLRRFNAAIDFMCVWKGRCSTLPASVTKKKAQTNAGLKFNHAVAIVVFNFSDVDIWAANKNAFFNWYHTTSPLNQDNEFEPRVGARVYVLENKLTFGMNILDDDILHPVPASLTPDAIRLRKKELIDAATMARHAKQVKHAIRNVKPKGYLSMLTKLERPDVSKILVLGDTLVQIVQRIQTSTSGISGAIQGHLNALVPAGVAHTMLPTEIDEAAAFVNGGLYQHNIKFGMTSLISEIIMQQLVANNPMGKQEDNPANRTFALDALPENWPGLAHFKSRAEKNRVLHMVVKRFDVWKFYVLGWTTKELDALLETKEMAGAAHDPKCLLHVVFRTFFQLHPNEFVKLQNENPDWDNAIKCLSWGSVGV